MVREQNMEKQMGGCMAGFFHIFDRQQNFTGKPGFATKCLPPAPAFESLAGSESTSPAASRDSKEQEQTGLIPSPNRRKQNWSPGIRSPAPEPGLPVAENPTRSPLPLPVFELREGAPRSPWRFSKEAPRLSLDSRAVVDAKGSLKQRETRTNAAILSAESEVDGDAVAADERQRGSPSVVARLMGLDQLPISNLEPTHKSELRRSASESRVNRGQYGCMEGFPFRSQQQQNPHSSSSNTVIRGQKKQNINNKNGLKEDIRGVIGRATDPRELRVRSAANAAPHRGTVVQRKNFDSTDFFPDPAKKSGSICGEIEKRLKMRGIDEPSKDLGTLKQILEALQLKGLLHPDRPQSRDFASFKSPIVVVRPARPLPVQPNRGVARWSGSESPASGLRSRPGIRRTAGELSQVVNPGHGRPVIDRRRSVTWSTRSECGTKTPTQRVPLTGDARRRVNEPLQQRRVSPIQSPKVDSRRTGQVRPNRSRRNQNPTAEILRKEEKTLDLAEDESSTVSKSSLGTCSTTDAEREYKEGRNLLERCGKLLNSIAEMTASTELQPSPVSVLDSSFYRETSPSPIFKRSIDFRDQSEDDMCSSEISSAESKSEEKSSDACDFAYVCDIIRASTHLPDDSDVFSLLEEQQCLKGKDASKASKLGRKLTFDAIREILDRKRKLPPWKTGEISLQQIWSEFQRIKERDESEELFEAICKVLRKDMAGDEEGWGECQVEASEAVLDIERLVFKDLIGETIRDLAAFAGTCRRLAF